MERVVIYPRSAYLKFLTLFLFILYPFRYLILMYYPESYVYRTFGSDLVLPNIPVITLGVFIFSSYLLALVIPKTSALDSNEKLVRFLSTVLVLESILYILAVQFLGMKMGSEPSIVAQIVAFFIFSLIPISFVAFSLLLLKPDHIFKTSIFYTFPFFLVASKSGLITFFLMFIFSRMLLGRRVLNMNVIIVSMLLISMYPFFMSIASYGRSGAEGSVIEYVENEVDSYGEGISDIYEFVVKKISKRVSGVDALVIEPMSNDVFSLGSVSLFLLKGIFTASTINYLMAEPNFGMGRLFAIEYFNQSAEESSSFEPTLLGVIWMSENSVQVYFLIFLSILILIILLRSIRSSIGRLFLPFYIYQLIILNLTGLISNITSPLRYLVCVVVIYYIYTSIYSLISYRKSELR